MNRIKQKAIELYRNNSLFSTLMIYTAEVKSKRELAPNILELILQAKKPGKIVFIAGQYVPFIISGKTRIYSMTSSPQKGEELSFCIDISPGGIGSKYAQKLKVGDEVKFNDPLGFFIADERDRDILFIATGVGIAPFKSIIPDLLVDGFKKKTTLLFGVRDQKNLFYADFFSELENTYPNFEFIPCLSQPDFSWGGQKGRVTEHLKQKKRDYTNRLIYICGAAEAVADIQDKLLEVGFPQKDFRVELFQ